MVSPFALWVTRAQSHNLPLPHRVSPMVSHKHSWKGFLFSFRKCVPLRTVSSAAPDSVLTSLHLPQVFLQVIGVIAVAAVIIPWILVPVAPLLAVFLYLRRYFLQTSRDIKRLESTSNLFFFSLSLFCGEPAMSICDKRQKQTTGMLIDHWRKPWSLA